MNLISFLKRVYNKKLIYIYHIDYNIDYSQYNIKGKMLKENNRNANLINFIKKTIDNEYNGTPDENLIKCMRNGDYKLVDYFVAKGAYRWNKIMSVAAELNNFKIVNMCIYRLKKDMLKDVKQNFRILHPLHKVTEIDIEVDETPYAYYFEHAANGLHIRKALLYLTTTN